MANSKGKRIDRSKKVESFSSRVREVVAKIPKGQVRTYQEVAKLAGNPRAYRAVGTILSKNFDLAVPCHRVIRSDGQIGNYNRGGSAKKFSLLRSEGAKF